MLYEIQETVGSNNDAMLLRRKFYVQKGSAASSVCRIWKLLLHQI
jgi:hypothetical protein